MMHQRLLANRARCTKLLCFTAYCFLGTTACDSGTEPDSSEFGSSQEAATTSSLMDQVASLSPPAIFVFDFDDTLYDHILDSNGKKIASQRAAYTNRGIDYLEQAGIRIAIASANNARDGLAKTLGKLDSSVFDLDFLSSPAFQTGTGDFAGKWVAIQKIIAYYDGLPVDSNGLPMSSIPDSRQRHVVFFDDKVGNTNYMKNNTSVVSVWVDDNGLDRDEFRGGVNALLEGSSGGGTCNVSQGHTDYCKLCGPCQEGEGDCDSDPECAGSLVCEPDGPGGEVCIKDSGSGER